MQHNAFHQAPGNENLLEQLYDIYDFIYIPLWNRTWFKISLIALLIISIVLIFLSIYYWYIRKKKPAWEVALQKLQRLSIDPQDAPFFYDQLMVIGKKYLETCKKLSFQDKTDQEFLAYILHITPTTMHDQLEKMIRNATLIKFADQQIQSDDMYNDRACMGMLIEELRPVAHDKKTIS